MPRALAGVLVLGNCCALPLTSLCTSQMLIACEKRSKLIKRTCELLSLHRGLSALFRKMRSRRGAGTHFLENVKKLTRTSVLPGRGSLIPSAPKNCALALVKPQFSKKVCSDHRKTIISHTNPIFFGSVIQIWGGCLAFWAQNAKGRQTWLPRRRQR